MNRPFVDPPTFRLPAPDTSRDGQPVGMAYYLRLQAERRRLSDGLARLNTAFDGLEYRVGRVEIITAQIAEGLFGPAAKTNAL